MRVMETDFTLFRAHAKLDRMFQGHQVEAYESVMNMTVERKSKVVVIMTQAYLTYASCQTLEGFEGGSTGFAEAFKTLTAESLQ